MQVSYKGQYKLYFIYSWYIFNTMRPVDSCTGYNSSLCVHENNLKKGYP